MRNLIPFIILSPHEDNLHAFGNLLGPDTRAIPYRFRHPLKDDLDRPIFHPFDILDRNLLALVGSLVRRTRNRHASKNQRNDESHQFRKRVFLLHDSDLSIAKTIKLNLTSNQVNISGRNISLLDDHGRRKKPQSLHKKSCIRHC